MRQLSAEETIFWLKQQIKDLNTGLARQREAIRGWEAVAGEHERRYDELWSQYAILLTKYENKSTVAPEAAKGEVGGGAVCCRPELKTDLGGEMLLTTIRKNAKLSQKGS